MRNRLYDILSSSQFACKIIHTFPPTILDLQHYKVLIGVKHKSKKFVIKQPTLLTTPEQLQFSEKRGFHSPGNLGQTILRWLRKRFTPCFLMMCTGLFSGCDARQWSCLQSIYHDGSQIAECLLMSWLNCTHSGHKNIAFANNICFLWI